MFVGIYETPAGTILYHAHLDIENFTLDRVYPFKHKLHILQAFKFPLFTVSESFWIYDEWGLSFISGTTKN